MDVETSIRKRRMVRAFASTPLEPQAIDDLLELSRRAPAAGNTQAVGFTVLDTPATTARYWATTLPEPKRERFRWQRLLDAPVLVLVTTRPAAYTERYDEADKARTGLGESLEVWPVPYWWVDAGAVVQNMLLLAVERGLGACLFGPFDNELALCREFGIHPDRRIVATIAIGHPLPDEPGRSAGRARKDVADLIDRPG